MLLYALNDSLLILKKKIKELVIEKRTVTAMLILNMHSLED